MNDLATSLARTWQRAMSEPDGLAMSEPDGLAMSEPDGLAEGEPSGESNGGPARIRTWDQPIMSRPL